MNARETPESQGEYMNCYDKDNVFLEVIDVAKVRGGTVVNGTDEKNSAGDAHI